MSTTQIADGALQALEAIRRALLREAQAIMLRLDTQRGSSVLLQDKQAAQTALAVARDLDVLLNERGITAIRRITEESALKALQDIAGTGTQIPATAAIELRQIVDGQMQEVAKVFSRAEQVMRSAIALGTTTPGSELQALTQAVSITLDTSVSKAQAAVDAAVLGAGRYATVVITEQAMATDGTDFVYVYDGPLDATTRPFCRAHLGKAYSQAALDKLDNGQLKPVSTFCGGYNCRHLLIPTLRATAQRRGIQIVE